MTEPGENERLDRELDELLQELRVLLPGTTVLFGFLLALSFSGQFGAVTGAERALFMVAFLTTALAVVLLVAPGVRHRTRFRERDKEALIRSANRIAIVAAALLAVALPSVTTLVCEHLYGWTGGLVAGLTLFVVATTMWFAWALARRVSGDEFVAPPATPVVAGRPECPPPGPAPRGTRADVVARGSGR